MDKILNDVELEEITNSMNRTMEETNNKVQDLLEVIRIYNEVDHVNKKNIEELVECNRSFSDYFDILEGKIRTLAICSNIPDWICDSSDMETLLDMLLESKENSIEEKCNNPKLDIVPTYAKSGYTVNSIVAKNKLPLDQCKVSISEGLSTYEGMFKEMLESSDIQYITNDDFIKLFSELLKVLSK